MSTALIERLAAADCFQPAFDLDELSERHVDFDVLVGDQRLARAGGSADQLPTHLPLPIGIAMADLDILTNQTRFAQFILADILQQARGHFSIQDRIRGVARKIERAAADETTRSAPHLGLTAWVKLPGQHRRPRVDRLKRP